MCSVEKSMSICCKESFVSNTKNLTREIINLAYNNSRNGKEIHAFYLRVLKKYICKTGVVIKG